MARTMAERAVCPGRLGPWLKEQYALEDHRGDPAYDATWTDMYEEYVEWIS